jgi:hypothetical protein
MKTKVEYLIKHSKYGYVGHEFFHDSYDYVCPRRGGAIHFQSLDNAITQAKKTFLNHKGEVTIIELITTVNLNNIQTLK